MIEIGRDELVQPFPSAHSPGNHEPERANADSTRLQEPEKLSESSFGVKSESDQQKPTMNGHSTAAPAAGPGTAAAYGRKRSNSQSQVVLQPKTQPMGPSTSSTASASSSLARQRASENPRKRAQVQYYVTLAPLNDTFTKKHLPVATFPDSTKLGRPTGTKHKPDVTNGYFDSRVLSRNHAQVYIDPKSGKLMLQDLGSSNGTYLNDTRLSNDPVEIKVGDTVCLGFNVQAESTHKQISLMIENINVIGNGVSSNESGIIFNKHQGLDSSEFKHLSFIEDIYTQITQKKKAPGSDSNPVKPNDQADHHQTKSQQASFESALFGDINPQLEDNLLGLYSSINSGIYNNSQLTNSGTLESTINTLIMNLTKAKQQNQSLSTLSNFFTNYQSKLKQLNSKFLDTEFKKHLVEIQTDLKRQKLSNSKLKERIKSTEDSNLSNVERLNSRIKALEDEREKSKVLLAQMLESERKRIEQEELARVERDKALEAERKEREAKEDARNELDINLTSVPIVPESIPLSTSSSNKSDSSRQAGLDLSAIAIGEKEGKSREESKQLEKSDTKKSLTTTQDTVVDVLGLFSESNTGVIKRKLLLDNKELLREVSPTPSTKGSSSSVQTSHYANGSSLGLTPPVSDEEAVENSSQQHREASNSGLSGSQSNAESKASHRADLSKETNSSEYSGLDSVQQTLSVSEELNGARSVALMVMVFFLGYYIQKLT